MEEDTIDLVDYLKVIWKRKILIIVVTLFCMVVPVVGVVLRPKPKLPVTYRADTVVKIGKKVSLSLAESNPWSNVSNVRYIEDPGELAVAIPLRYGFKVERNPGYHLDIKRINNYAMLELVLRGPDKGVEGVLKELVDILANEHRRIANDSVNAFKKFMIKLENDAEALEEGIVLMEARIKEMKRVEREYLAKIDSSSYDRKTGGDRSAFLNMLYLKAIDTESELNNSQTSLRNIKKQLMMQQIALGNLEEYKTEMVGGIRCAAEVANGKQKRTIHKIMIAGVAGLMMSLFIAFFMEYIEESKPRRKGK